MSLPTINESDIDEITNAFSNIPTNVRIELESQISKPSLSENSINNKMSLPQIHVKDFLDLIPQFNGEPTQLPNFIRACENVIPLMAPNNEPQRISFTMLHIRTKLIGKAAALLATRPFQTFPELKFTLTELFGDQRNEESLLSDLNSLRQKQNETPTQFADRCIDLRSLLMAKLECSNELLEIKNHKMEMYNKLTLRSYLTGLNSQLSYLIRCQNPPSIERAIQIAIEEENINYHRQRLTGPTQNNKQNFKTTNNNVSQQHQLRLNPAPTRVPQFGNYQQQFQQNTQKQWQPRTFSQNNHQPFSTQPGTSRNFPPRPSTNVFRPKNIPQNKPTPMDVSSGNTVLKSKPQPRWTSEELYIQETENDFEEPYQSQPENNYNYQDSSPYESEPNYYYNSDAEEHVQTEIQNFQITASDSSKMNN